MIDAMSVTFVDSDYKDEYNARVKQAIKDKAKGKEIKMVDSEKTVNITDLMDALTQSVKNIEELKKDSKVVKIKKKA